MATYVNDLRLKEIATGDEAGTWGTSTNTNLELIGEAFSFGTEAITTNADTHTTTIADGSTDPGRSMYLKYTGTLDSACTITIGPNTVSKMWFIENATSGSQNIIISQGSGANITIPAGDVKVVYSDGAGSGAAVVDAFASLSVVDLKVQDDLTVTDDMTVGGTLGVTGIVTLTDDLIIGDGKTIGSASDVDAMTIAANGQVTLTQTLIGTALDISGDIDVDGTTNLDVVDIDGAVDMASTLTVAGVLTGASLDISGDIDVDGTTNLDVVDIDGAVDMASTLNVSGAITGTLGTAAQPNITSLGTLTTLTVDDITINGSTISDSGDLTLDVGGDIYLDSDNANWRFNDAGTAILHISKPTGAVRLQSSVADADIIFGGIDGSTVIEALTLDMSNAGAATFNSSVRVDNQASTPVRLQLNNTGSNDYASIYADTASAYKNLLLNPDGGSVGIGISPSNTFSVGASGTVTTRYTSTDTSAFSLLQFENNGSIVLSADHGDSASSTEILFKTDGGTERAKIDSNGDSQFQNRIFAGGGTGANTSVNADDIVIGLTDNSTERGITIASTVGGGIRWNDGADAGTLQYVHSTNRFQFYTAGSLRASIDSEGLKFNGDTAAANALDDYEEGSWTGTLTGTGSAPTTAVTKTGYYTKIGNIVTLWIEFSNVNTTGASGAAKITGQPFNPASGKSAVGGGFFGRAESDLIGSYITSTSGGILWIDYQGNGANYATTGAGTYVQATITFSVS